MRIRGVLSSICLIGLMGSPIADGQTAGEAIPNWPAPSFWEPPGFDRFTGIPGHEAGARQLSVLAASSSPLPFIPITPCRVVDTRGNGFTGAYGPPGLVGNGPARNFNIPAGPCPGIPAGAGAYSINVAAILPASDGFMTVFPTGAAQPVSSDLNFLGGEVIANALVVPAGTNGAISIFVNVSTHMILDINGYYAGAAIGDRNTFLGPSAGNSTMTGNSNTGIGAFALSGNTTGSNNTALGRHALPANTTGDSNTASGVTALFSNTSGTDNTATGYGALQFNTSGDFNTATGVQALALNASGDFNTAIGNDSLFNNTVGSGNTAVGNNALANVSGPDAWYNIGIGNNGGSSLTTGSENICIGAFGVAGESLTIRIGQNQTAAYIAGISGRTSSGGVGVLINSNGKLGTTTSSRRFKENIRAIGAESNRLMQLRPVAFEYKRDLDSTGLTQYGLIAEEVAEIYPDLVALDRDGRPEAVRYHLINTLLLNEVQGQRRFIEFQQSEIDSLEERLRSLEARLSP